MNNMSQLHYETFYGTLKRHDHVKNTKLVHNAFVIIKHFIAWIGTSGNTFEFLILVGPYILIYCYSTTNKMHLLCQIIYCCKMLYMFWAVFPSIIRSSKVHIRQRYMSNSCCYLLLLGMRWNSSPIAVGSSSCLTCTVAVYAVLSS